MKKEVEKERYDDLCDKVRSLILYTEVFSIRNKKRMAVVRELTEIVRSDGIELIEKVRSLESLIDKLCEIKTDES